MEIESEFINQEELLKCRCCMKSEDLMENMFEIVLTTKESQEFLLADILSSITDLKYSIDDGLTPFVCPKCCQIILAYQNFKSECREIDNLFRSHDTDAADLTVDNSIVEIEQPVKYDESQPSQHDLTVYEELIVEQVELYNEPLLKVSKSIQKNSNHTKEKLSTTNDLKKKHQCSICSKRFESPAKVRRHLHVHRDVLNEEDLPEKRTIYLNYTCDICQRKVETPSKLERHMRVHDKNSRLYSGVNTQRPLGCTKCDMRFWDEIKLEKHQIVHSDALKMSEIQYSPNHSFVCVICNERPKTFDELIDHIKSHSEELANKSKIQCRLCSNTYSSLSNVIRHAKCHSENATHKCTYCGKLMGYGEDFLNHLLRHQNFKPFACKKCDKSFNILQKFNQHQLKHSKESLKIFECDHCEKKFSNLEYLKNHLACHYM